MKATLFEERLSAVPLVYRKGNPEDIIVSDCLTRIAYAIQNDLHVEFIGSSFGGFLAVSTALIHTNVTRLVLLNPTIIPPGTDIRTIRGIPQRIAKEMIEPRLFEEKIKAKILILRGSLDDVVPSKWIVSFANAQQATIRTLVDDHQFTKNTEKLTTIIMQYLKS